MIITAWQRFAKDEDGVEGWHHNHISAGFDPLKKHPEPVKPEFKAQALWKNAQWRGLRANLVNGVVTFDLEAINC